jgi:hypothetical protein
MTILTGCTNSERLKNNEKMVVNQPVPQKVKDIENSKAHSLEEILNNTTGIDVNFDSTEVYSSNKAIVIKDEKMLKDILTMIGESQLIKDESKIANMSGMAAKSNKLTLAQRDGSNIEIKFVFDDPAFAVGYLEIDGIKYDPGFFFFRYIRDLKEYKQYSTNIESNIHELFRQYNWTVDYRINTLNVELPKNLKYDAGEFPVKIYWAYNNKLSKSIGLDYSEYLGKKVDTHIYRLREPLPDYMNPRMDARGIVLEYEKKIIGAYIDAGRHSNFACSLDRKTLEDITNMQWDNWVSEYIDYDNALQIKLSKMTPEEIINQYYNAIDKHDEKIQFACMTLQNVCNYLAMNMDNNLLINEGFNSAYAEGEQNIKSAKFIKLREINVPGNPRGTVEYEVTIDFKFNKEITSSSGRQTRFVILKKESDKIGWRIQSEGTGP